MNKDKIEQIRLQSMLNLGFGVDSMKAIKICKNCKTPASDAHKICKECGYLLPNTTLFDMYKDKHLFCRFCDTVVAEDSIYCPQCGTKICTRMTRRTKL